jgi:DNA-binding response OmpR family regulator
MGVKKRVLIIDDAVFQSEILAEVFQNEFGDKIEIEIARAYEDAEDFILGKDFDLILIDYLLGPNLTAVSLKKELVEKLATKAKWVLLSALDVLQLKEKHANEGFDDFVHKSDYRVVTGVVKNVLFPFD